jgi:GNAT superfamily N-acetyltransferase
MPGSTQSGLRIARLGPGQQEAAVRVLARAFRDNPLDVAVIGGDPERRLRAITYSMRAALRSAAGPGLVLVAELDEDGSGPVGVLVAIPPDGFPLPPPPLLGHLRSLFGQGLRVSSRWGEVFRTLADVHPGEGHWYLSLLGVDPPRRGTGIGSALLQFWLECVDRDGLPSYLETDRRENLPFYNRAGFAVERELPVLGTPVWCMRRPPPRPAVRRH